MEPAMLLYSYKDYSVLQKHIFGGKSYSQQNSKSLVENITLN